MFRSRNQRDHCRCKSSLRAVVVVVSFGFCFESSDVEVVVDVVEISASSFGYNDAAGTTRTVSARTMVEAP